jgi:hypothetical protein
MSVLVVGPRALVPVQGTKSTRWWTALTRYFAADSTVVDTDSGDRRYPRRYPPKSYVYLQDSAMRRAMERL